MKKTLIGLTLCAALSASAQPPASSVVLDKCVLTQNPQNRNVEVAYELTGDMPVYITLDITTNDVPIPVPATVWGAITTVQNPVAIVPTNNVPLRKIHWNAPQDWPSNLTTQAVATVTAWFTNAPPARLKNYVVIDLSEGADADVYPYRYSIAPPNLADATCKTTELWLRRIPAGTFMMGSPNGEPGRAAEREVQHEVTLTKDFYIGVFEVTQKQYERVTGTNPAQYKGDTRPVDGANYDMIRGAPTSWPWPQSDAVDPDSFMGLLRKKTGFKFDLPTDAQWEYACRAGTTTALNSGKDMEGEVTCSNLAEVGRYAGNRGTGQHTVVGSYEVNAWGFYDMHGNILEWCLDRFEDGSGNGPVTDPKGPTTGTTWVVRGGHWDSPSANCRSARRAFLTGTSSNTTIYGFRACIQLP